MEKFTIILITTIISIPIILLLIIYILGYDYFKSVKKRDPAARNYLQIILTYPGVHALFYYRIAHFFYLIKLKLISEIITYVARFLTHIEIHAGAQIGKRLFIDHGAGVVIGETAIIGDDCLMYHGVTLGGRKFEKIKRHPTIGKNVMIGTGAKILGNVIVGDNVQVAANAIILGDVPNDITVIGKFPVSRAEFTKSCCIYKE